MPTSIPAAPPSLFKPTPLLWWLPVWRPPDAPPSQRRASFAPQARVGSRRLRRLFAEKKKLSQGEFVGILEEEFNRRIARGLSIGRAVLEIQVNMPLEGVLAAEYGNE